MQQLEERLTPGQQLLLLASHIAHLRLTTQSSHVK
jgi:hypothetical protein